MYKIEIINSINDYYKQLEILIKEFAINIYITQKFNLINISNKVKYNIIDDYLKLLTDDDYIMLQEDIKKRTEFAKKAIENDSEIKTRYYVLIHDDEVVGFQTAQIRNNEGWRNFAYMKKDYLGKKDKVITTFNEEKDDLLSNVLYENISDWFRENNIVIEKTATGKRMFKNILAYMVYKGFNIYYIDGSRIYLVKDYNNLKTKEELKKLYKTYKRCFYEV